MSNLINFLWVNPCKLGIDGFCDGIIAFFWQIFYLLLGTIYKVLGLFADLLNVAFYIFAGVELNSQKVDGTKNLYAVEVGTNGDRQNILDYFVLSESMQKAYLWMALLGLLLVVVFTIYKIVKQDYFDKAGPRSKGPIFRNVAISCISFLLVIPIFWIIIHVSSLLAVAVMSNLGMDVNTFAGTKIFLLSWSDNGETFRIVNNMLHENGDVTTSFNFMNDMHPDAIFTLVADGEYVRYDDSIMTKLNSDPWTGKITMLTYNGEAVQPTFYWYIYLVGIVVGIKSLYTLVLAMIQRIFKLMGLFLVAPSPISQYVLDDGQKFKNWLAQSIQEGLRLVVACMSFAIYLMVLNLVKDINFITAFINATGDKTQYADNFNVSTDLLSYEREFINDGFIILGGDIHHTWDEIVATGGNVIQDPGSYISNAFFALVNAFFKILLLMGAGGAIVDLDPVLTPLISGGRSSLDAGQTGKSVDAGVQTVKQVAGAMVGGTIGGLTSRVMAAKAIKQGKMDGAIEAKDEAEKVSKSDAASGKPESSTPGGANGPGARPSGEGKEETPSSSETAHDSESAGAPSDKGDGKSDEKGGSSFGSGAGETSTTSSSIPKDSKKVTKLARRAGGYALSLGKFVGGGVLGAGKGVLRAAKSTPGAIFDGLKSGLGTATKLLATAVVGKDTVGAFMDSKKKTEEKGREKISKSYDKAKTKGYQHERKNQIKEAEKVTQQEAKEVTESADDLSKMVGEEKDAASALDEANMEAGKSKQVAEEAESALIEADESKKGPGKGAKSRKQQVEAATKSVKEAEKSNAEIEASYGTKAEMKRKIAEYKATGNDKAADAYQAQLTAYEKNEKKISTGRTTLDKLNAESDRRSSALSMCVGKGGSLSKAGITDKMTYREAMDQIDKKLGASDLSEDDRTQLESLQSAMKEVGAETYDSVAAQTARQTNVDYQAKSEVREKAQDAYDKAHNATQAASTKLQNNMKAYTNSVNLAVKLDEASDKSIYGKKTETIYSVDAGKGIVGTKSKKNAFADTHRKHQSEDRKQKIGKMRRQGTTLQSEHDKAMQSMAGIEGPKNITYADILNARVKENEDMMHNANTTFGNQASLQSDKTMTLVTNKGVDATSALDASTGEIKANANISATQAQQVQVDASAAAVANFKMPSGGRKAQIYKQQILDACMKDGIIDFAAIDAERGQHQSKHVDAALDKLKADYLAQARSKLSNFGEEKTTMKVGDFVSKYTRTDGTYDFVAMKDELDRSASNGGRRSGLETYVDNHAATQQRYTQTNAKISTSRSAMEAIGTMQQHEMEQVSSNMTRLKTVNSEVSVLNQIIAQAQSGQPVTLDASQRRMIGSAIGMRGGTIRTSDPTKIVEYATQARETKREEQVRLTQSSEDHARQSSQLSAELETMMNSVMGNIGAKPQESQQVNNNNVTNNNVVNNNTTAPQGQYWFNGEQGNGSSAEMPSASGLNQSRNMADMYERIQVEGIKHMESMLEQMRTENRNVAKEVSSVKKTVEEIKED